MGVKAYIRFLLAFYKMEWAAAMQYRLNFIMQTVFMFLNDVMWIFFWYLLFARFGTIKGYTYEQLLLLWSFATLSFAITHIFFGNIRHLAKIIEDGKLDYYLSLPKNELLHVLAHLSYSAVGDLIFGLVLAFWTVRLDQAPLFTLLVLTGTITMLGWALLTQSGAFFFSSFESAGRSAFEIFLTPSLYPFSVFGGFTRFLLLFIVPAGFVAGIPVELMTSFSWTWLAISIGFCLAFISFAVWVFYQGLKRYESGNQLGMRE